MLKELSQNANSEGQVASCTLPSHFFPDATRPPRNFSLYSSSDSTFIA